MRKLLSIIGIFIFITFISCKTDSKPNETETTEVTESGQNENQTDNQDLTMIETPEFSNSEVQKFAEEYAVFYSKVKESILSGESEKLSELQNESTDWARKAQELTQRLSESDKEIWENWTKEIAEEVAEMQ